MKKFQFLVNNWYALKTIWLISKKRVLHTIIYEIVGYGEWVFFSIFFLRYIINAIEQRKPFEAILVFIGICCFIFSILALYNSYHDSFLIPYTDNEIYGKLHQKIYQKASNVELHCYEDPDFYNRYTMTLSNAVKNITESLIGFFRIILGAGAAAVAFYSMFKIDPYSVLFVISPLIGNFVFGNIMNNIRKKRYAEGVPSDRKIDYVNRVMHLADFAKEIRFSNIHRLMMHHYDKAIDEKKKNVDRHWKRASFYTWVQNVTTFALVFEGIMIYVAYRTIISQSMDLSELAIMFSTMSVSSWILIEIFNCVIENLKNCQFVQYYQSFMQYQEKIPEDQDGVIPDPTVHHIEFRNVTFSYQKVTTIKNLSFIIHENEVVAFVGHNGAGKSTIIKLLFRLYDPTEGVILVNGVDIRKYNLQSYRALFATAFQDYKLMALSIKDNVLMGENPQNADEVVYDALKCAGIDRKVASLSKGIHTILTKEFDNQGVVLSGGEQQKIVIARAFAKNASVRIFDEPTSALDPIAEYELYKNIMEQRKSHMILFISHRLSSVKDSDRVFLLEHGQMIEQGTHRELMNHRNTYYDIFLKQAEKYLAVPISEEKVIGKK